MGEVLDARQTREAARASVTGAAAFAVVVLALEGLQRAIDPFEPRAEMTVAIVAAVVFATLIGERLRVRRSDRISDEERTEKLRRATMHWEPPRLQELDPYKLGTFPSRRGRAADAGDYVRRPVHNQIRDALEAAPFVLIFGGVRAGKSRIAFEAARESEALSDSRVLVPRDADGLRVLLESGPALRCNRVVLWLDALERFADVLDATVLERLRATHVPGPPAGDSLYAGPPVTVIATIREATWDRLLASDGQVGEFAKAVASSAQAYGVATRLDPQKERAAAAEARKLYLGVDFGAGIGPALAASGKGEEAPSTEAAAKPAAEEGQDERPAWFRRQLIVLRRDKLLLAPVAGFLAACLTVAVIWLGPGFSTPEPLPLGVQAAQIRASGAQGTRTANNPERVDFHGSGQKSYVFSFRDQDRTQTDRSRADEIRVYDVEGDELEERFRFQPDDLAVYQYRGAKDVDGDGAEELIGGFGPMSPLGELLVPFALDLNDDSGEYQIVSLHPSKPQLDAASPARQSAAKVLAPYRQLATYRDSERGLVLRGYPAQDIAVAEGSPHLISGYYITDPATERTASIELQLELFDTQGSGPRLRGCEFPDGDSIRARDQADLLLFQVLLARWSKVSEDRRCVPVF